MSGPEFTSPEAMALLHALGRPRTLLDVGGAAAAALVGLRRSGTRLTGVESTHRLAARLEPLLDEVLVVDPENEQALAQSLAGRRFEVIVVRGELLDRGRSREGLLACLAGCLEPEGRLVVRVDNEAGPLGGVATGDMEAGGGGSAWQRGPTSPEGVACLLSRAGLEILRVEQGPASGFFGAGVEPDQAPEPSVSRSGQRFDRYWARLERSWPGQLGLTWLVTGTRGRSSLIVARLRPRAGPLSLTVGMLTRDEEPSILRMIEAIREQAPDARLLCVDSSTQDRTALLAEQMGARVVRQLPPRGHGPAMELLMYEAARQSEALIYLDCDFTYPPTAITPIRRILESGVDVVNAARTRRRPPAMPRPNYLANRAFACLARWLHSVPVSDLHSGMRGYRTSVIRAFAFDGSGDAIPIDTLLWPVRCGYRVVEVPIEYYQRVGFSKLRKLSGTYWTLVRLSRTMLVGGRGRGQYEVWDRLDAPRDTLAST